MTTPNPFDHDIFAEGLPGAEGIHDDVLQALARSASELDDLPDREVRIHAFGRTTLLLAPRAGYGKSHLLSRLARNMGDRTLFIPLQFQPESPISWVRLAQELIAYLMVKPLEEGSKLTLLDDTARFFFAQLVMAGIERKLVEADDPESAMEYIYENYRTLFDPRGGSESRAKWLEGAYEPLIRSLTADMSIAFGIPEPAVKFWARVFYHYIFPTGDSLQARSNPLKWALGIVQAEAEPTAPEQTAKQHFCDLAQIVSSPRPVVFVVDHLDGFHRQQAAGMDIAHILAEVARNIPRSLTVISTNLDIWNSVFTQAIPSAIEDRLTWDTRQLKPLSVEEGEALIRHRVDAAGFDSEIVNAFLSELNLPAVAAKTQETSFTPRTLIRYARRMWESFDFQARKHRDKDAAAAKTVPFPIPKPEKSREGSATPKKSPVQPPKLPPREAQSKAHQMAASIQKHGAESVSRPRPPEPSGGASALAATFQDFRAKHADAQVLPFDPKQIHALVSAVGNHFPAVHQTDVEISSEDQGKAVKWSTQNREILLGFGARDHDSFWKDLIQVLKKRVELLSGSATKVKMVFFSPHGDPISLNKLLSGQEDSGSLAKAIDRVELDQNLLATLYAARDLIRASREGSIDATPAQVFGFVATELDFFWRRLTRIGDGTASGSAAAAS